MESKKDCGNVFVKTVGPEDIEKILRSLLKEENKSIDESLKYSKDKYIIEKFSNLVANDIDINYEDLPNDESILDIYDIIGHLDNHGARLVKRKAYMYAYTTDQLEDAGFSLKEIAEKLLKTNNSKGFDKFKDDFLANIALVHSELSEAVEEFRNSKPAVYFGKDGKPEGVAIELVDAWIRITNMLSYLEVDMENLVCIKDVYNGTRGYLHGKNR